MHLSYFLGFRLHGRQSLSLRTALLPYRLSLPPHAPTTLLLSGCPPPLGINQPMTNDVCPMVCPRHSKCAGHAPHTHTHTATARTWAHTMGAAPPSEKFRYEFSDIHSPRLGTTLPSIHAMMCRAWPRVLFTCLRHSDLTSQSSGRAY